MQTDFLSAGIYSIPKAARLLDVSPARLRGWVRGYHGMKSPPIITSEFQPIDHQIAISFVNLIEARFIQAFSKLGVSVRSIRYMAEEANLFLNHPHPFATKMIFRTDGRKIFVIVAEKTRDKKLYDLRGKNWGMYEVLAEGLKKDVLYGSSGIAEAWYPRKETAPEVIVHPKIAFGQPALDDSGVPTETLYDAFIAEGKNYTNVARWYGLPIRRVKEAIKFEVGIRTIN